MSCWPSSTWSPSARSRSEPSSCLNTQTLALGDLLDRDPSGAVVGDDRDLVEPIVILEADPAGDLGDRDLGDTGLEQLLDARQTTGDVVTDATLVEGAHGQLRTGLTNRLGRDDATASPMSTSLPVAIERP